jgi:hypothetical protein
MVNTIDRELLLTSLAGNCVGNVDPPKVPQE